MIDDFFVRRVDCLLYFTNAFCFREVVKSSSINYGFPFMLVEPGILSWGILDQWSLVSVSLKCEPVTSYSHENKNSLLEPKFSATAM